jgi:spore maturation protein A
MKWVFAGLIVCSILFGAGSGHLNEVSNAAISGCSNAVTLSLKLMGSICLWSGLMKIAQKSALTDKISKLLHPITRRLFWDLPAHSPALPLICMNITANLLGLGNAATPLGIAAMQALSDEQPKHLRHTASVSMITLVVLNTASIQLLPTTIALLRLEYGASNPLDILPSILLSSFVSVCVGLTLVQLFAHAQKKARRDCPSSLSPSAFSGSKGGMKA